MKKKLFDYRIAIKFNINHSVTEEETEGVDKVALRSKPDFEIDITRGDVILGFNCSYANNFDNTELDESNGTGNHIYYNIFFTFLNCIILQMKYFTSMKLLFMKTNTQTINMP